MPFKKRILLYAIILLSAAYADLPGTVLLHRIIFNVGQFLSVGTDYERLYAISRKYRLIRDANMVIPPHAAVQLSYPSSEFGFDYILYRYHLYPRKLAAHGDYVVDIDRTMTLSSLPSVTLREGTKVFGRAPLRMVQAAPAHERLMSIPLLTFGLLSAWILLIGALFMRGFGFQPASGCRGWFYSSSYLMGLLSTAGVTWVIMMMGVPLRAPYLLVQFVIMTIGAYSLRWLTPADRTVPPAGGMKQGVLKTTVLERAGTALACTLIALFLAVIISIPVSVWDEMFIWILKARHFYHEQALDFSFSVSTNTYYPVLWPVHNAIHFAFAGDHDEITKWSAAAVFLSCLLQLRAALQVHGLPRVWVWPLTAAYVCLFHHWSFFTALPEGMFLAFLTAIITAVLIWSHDPATRGAYLKLGLLMALGLSQTKVEGAAVSILCGCALLAAFKSLVLQRRNIGVLAAFFCFPLLSWAWAAWIEAQGTPVSFYHLKNTASVENMQQLAGVVVKFAIDSRAWLLAAAWGGTVFVWTRRPFNDREKFLLCLLGGLVVMAMAAGLCWPAEDFRKYYAEVFTRLLARAAPALMLVWTARLFIRPGER